jgi:hypothetical protein
MEYEALRREIETLRRDAAREKARQRQPAGPANRSPATSTD